MGVEPSTLATITGAKAVANTALRWIPPFLPTLEGAFGATTTQLTTVIGASEFAGLSTLAVGDHLDRGTRTARDGRRPRPRVASRRSSPSAGRSTTFAVAFVVLVLGVSNYTVAGHTWISHRVAYRWRARSFGIFEMSWALALLVGAPIVAVLINRFGWRGPFVALAIAAAVRRARRRLEAAERRRRRGGRAPPSTGDPTPTSTRTARSAISVAGRR